MLAPLRTRVPLPACTTDPVPLMTLLKSVPWAMVLLRLKASVPLFVIALDVERDPVVLPLPSWSVPALMVVEPLYVFAPLRMREPLPAFVRPKPVPEMTPPTVRLLLPTVTMRLAFMATAPVPILRAFAPRKETSAFQFCALLLVSVMAPPLVLSNAPPAIVKFPVPMAVALLILSCPPERVVLPV